METKTYRKKIKEKTGQSERGAEYGVKEEKETHAKQLYMYNTISCVKTQNEVFF